MKKILSIIAALLIWAAILILCGEKTDAVSWTTFYVWKAGALATLVTCAVWLDRKEYKKEHTK